MSNIRLRNVTKRFGSTVTLPVNLDIEDGEFAVFVSPFRFVENRRCCV